MSRIADDNAGFVECWNEILTPKWIRFRHLLSGNGKIHSDIAKIVRESGEEGQRKLPEIRRDLRELMTTYLRPDGVFMPSSTWAIMARKP